MLKDDVREYMKVNLGIDDSETFEMLYANYVDTVKQSLGKIRALLAEGNIGELRGAGHALKGCSANIGAESLRAAALAMENAGKEGNAAAARAVLAELEQLQAQL